MDKIKQLLMAKWDIRRTISRKIEGVILPHIIKELKEKSRNLDMDVQRSEDIILAVVSVKGGSGFKFVVNLAERTCLRRRWQISGIPCRHAIHHLY
jgi:predicted GTPase